MQPKERPNNQPPANAEEGPNAEQTAESAPGPESETAPEETSPESAAEAMLADRLMSPEPLTPADIAESLEHINDPHLSHLVLTNAKLNGHKLTRAQAERLMENLIVEEDTAAAFYIELLASGVLGLPESHGGLSAEEEWWADKLVDSLLETDNADLAASILEAAAMSDAPDMIDDALRMHLESLVDDGSGSEETI